MEKINFKSSAFDLTEAIKEYIHKKFDGLFSRYEILDSGMYMEIGKTTKHHKQGDIFFAEVSFKTKNKKIFARAQKEDIYQATDALLDEIVSQLEFNKGRMDSLWKKGARKIKNFLKSS